MDHDIFNHRLSSTRDACGISAEREDEMQDKLDEVKQRLGLESSRLSEAIEVLAIVAAELPMTPIELIYSSMQIGRLFEVQTSTLKKSHIEELLKRITSSDTENDD